MSFEETIKKMLAERGLFDNQCNEILARMKVDPANDAMKDRWQDSTEGYPPIMLNLAWYSARKHALDFIDENCPKAWFRPMFTLEPK